MSGGRRAGIVGALTLGVACRQIARGGDAPPKRTARENVKLCFRSIDVLLFAGLIGFLLYCMQRDYGLNVFGLLAEVFPREMAVLQRLFNGVDTDAPQ